MGLYQSIYRFDGTLPELDAVYAEARRRLGSTYGIHGLTVSGDTVVARSTLDPFAYPVVCAILEELGGQRLDGRNGQPAPSEVPSWAHAPIRDMPWYKRLAVRYRWRARLSGISNPR